MSLFSVTATRVKLPRISVMTIVNNALQQDNEQQTSNIEAGVMAGVETMLKATSHSLAVKMYC